MKHIANLLVSFVLLLSPLHSYSQNNIQRYIDKLKKDTLFVNSVTGVMVMDSRGKTIASWNPDMPLLTASTLKTITTGLALRVLGPEFKFKTKIAHSGYVENGVLYGDLYIVGGADPTLGSTDTLGIPLDTLFSSWGEALREYGIKRINGSIVADDRFFESEIVPETWTWDNIGASYGHGASGLSFYENTQTFTFIPGVNAGDETTIKNHFPFVPGMEYQNRITTGESKSGDRSSYFLSDLSKNSLFRGTLPLDRDSVMVTVANKFPHLSCAYHFREYLNRIGIFSKPQILDAKEISAPREYELTVITESESAPLYKIVNVTNRISNNFYAETLFKMIGKKRTGVGSYDSAKVAAIREISSMGLSTRGYKQSDGSGLSRVDLVSPRFFCNYYRAMEKSNVFPYFFESFPYPGGGGTLKNVLLNKEKREKERIHAKSGSLNGVRCYAGYVERGKGEYLYFAILCNNYSALTSKMQVGIEGIMNELTKY